MAEHANNSSFDQHLFQTASHMTLDELLAQLEALGTRLIALEDGRLGLQLPPQMSTLPLPLVAVVREHKAELLELLMPQCLYEDHQNFWRHPVGYWVCSLCRPAPAADVETISLAMLTC
jgi:hypothetical protein